MRCQGVLSGALRPNMKSEGPGGGDSSPGGGGGGGGGTRAGGAVVRLTGDSFEAVVFTSTPAFIEIYAPWCGRAATAGRETPR